jgi:translation initiation factor IF-2
MPPPQAAKAAPFLPPTPSAAASSVTITEEGGVKIIHLKPPIIVRDFAVALGSSPSN